MAEHKKLKKFYSIFKGILEFFTLVSFIALTLYMGKNHEPWADESQAWLLARDSSIIELITIHSKYEGTPMLWHIILKGFITCGLPYTYYYIIPIIFTSIGVAIFEFKTKMPLLLKIIFPFTYYIFYQYTIVARSYCLVFPALMLLSLVYDKKLKMPFLFGICITILLSISTHMTLLAACICFVYGINVLIQTIKAISRKYSEDRIGVLKILENWLVIILLLAVFLGVAYFLIPPEDQSEMQIYGKSINYGRIYSIISDSMVTNTTEFLSDGIDTIRLNTQISAAVAIVSIILAFAIYFRDKKFYIFLLYVLPQYLFLAFFYCNKWHLGMLFETILFCLIIHKKLERVNFYTFVFLIIEGIQIYYSYMTCTYDLSHMYSGSADIAKFLINNNYQNKVIYGVGYSPTSIEPYFEKSIFANKLTGKGYYEWKSDNADYMTIDQMKKEMPDILIISAFRDYNYLTIVNRTEASYLYDKYYFEGATYVKDNIYENEGFYVYVSKKLIQENRENNKHSETVVFE